MSAPVVTGPADGSSGGEADGRFGRFGGRMMPEALMAALDELTVAWQDAMADPEFTAEFERMLREYAGSAMASCQATVSSSSAAISASGIIRPPNRPKVPSPFTSCTCCSWSVWALTARPPAA